jgi:hypothetical protein
MIDPYCIRGFLSYFLLALGLGLGWVLGCWAMSKVTQWIDGIFKNKAQ